MSVEELESVVSGLPPAKLARFSQWFEEFAADQWDRQIEQTMQAVSMLPSSAPTTTTRQVAVGRFEPLSLRKRDEVVAVSLREMRDLALAA